MKIGDQLHQKAIRAQAASSPGKNLKWAMQDSNNPPKPPGKPPIPDQGAAKGAADGDKPDIGALLAAILALPLTPTEKAEAVRAVLRLAAGA